ncbi:cytochrome P450 [Pseudonocardia alni]|uniref:cytochrome P450 n=1 Tax=Pseudonocardia alni TaxID=33907 RepID=UPI0033F4E664
MTVSQTGSTYRLPPGPRWPAPVQAAAFLGPRARTLPLLRRRFGSVFSLRLPFFGPTVVVCDRDLVKQVFTTPTDVLGNHDVNLGSVLGERSMFALDGDEHRRQRKLLLPPFAGRRMAGYAELFASETRREMESWPLGSPFAVLPATNRITLTVILKAVFGAEAAEFEQLRELIGPMIALAQKLDLLAFARRDLGPWSPWGRYLAHRRRFDELVGRLIAIGRADPDLAARRDVLVLMLQARYDDGSAMSDAAVCDQLLTMLAAGHETTATSLAWALERLSRHPRLLRRLVAEIDAGETDELLRATIQEVHRTRPVIDLVARCARRDVEIGPWRLPAGTTVMVGIATLHQDATVFPDPHRFDPDRFLGVHPDHYAWIPFGGGTRRCIGAAFADMEMLTVLRTVLTDLELSPSVAPPERPVNLGVTFAPSERGRVVLHRRTPAAVRPVVTGATA